MPEQNVVPQIAQVTPPAVTQVHPKPRPVDLKVEAMQVKLETRERTIEEQRVIITQKENELVTMREGKRKAEVALKPFTEKAAQVDILNIENGMLTKKVATLSASNDSLRKNTRELQGKVASLQAIDFRGELDSARETVKTLRTLVEEREATIKKLAQELLSKQGELEALVASKNDVVEECQKLAAYNEDLKKKLEAKIELVVKDSAKKE